MSNTLYKLQDQYTIKALCRVLKVNRSTYYKHFYSKHAPRTCENQVIRKHILQIYSNYDNYLGAYKIRRVLERDYGINISLGRVYRLMNTMNLPKRSTEKRKWKHTHKENDNCINHLNQQFNLLLQTLFRQVILLLLRSMAPSITFVLRWICFQGKSSAGVFLIAMM